MNQEASIKSKFILHKQKYLVIAISILFLISKKGVGLAQSILTLTDQDLAERYTPILYFHRDELFRPQSVDVLVQTARLRQDIRFWFDVNILNEVSIRDLITYNDASYVLDIWYGNSGTSDYKNYSAHKAYYEEILSPEAGGPPITTYAHVIRDTRLGKIIIQYWLFYYYNDWFNKHEGDWEFIQIILNEDEKPEWVILSQHNGGTRRKWEDTQIEDGTHPVVFVALGSHANYFWGNEIYPNGQDIGNLCVWINDITGTHGRVKPKVILIPGREDLEISPLAWLETEWMFFSGHWGELAINNNFSGPLGPADKGKQWARPYEWGMEQPLDITTWYQNRLRIEILDESKKSIESKITLRNILGAVLFEAESTMNTALLHEDPPVNTQIIADIEYPQGQPFNIIATWPDVENSRVFHYNFSGISLISSGKAKLIFSLNGKPTLRIPGVIDPIQPISSTSEPAIWDAPDLVWAAGLLPIGDVAKGIIVCVLASFLPTILYISIIYWNDRYEKEPRSLIATAFIWGAIPAILIAIVIEIFFELPIELMGPQAIEALHFGYFTPIIEETLKCTVIIYISRRYRYEFDNVLDGIIYGAVVGLGFTMTGNTLCYLGAFFLRGFSGLKLAIFIKGILFGINHALYSSIFGAGLGFARLRRKRTIRWSVPFITFLMAICINALHNFATQKVLGLNLLSILLPWVGLLVIVIIFIWSLQRQKIILETELIGEIPGNLYKTIINIRTRNKSLQQSFFLNGIKEWQKLRYLYQLCAELAFKKMQGKRFPEDQGIEVEIKKLRRKIFELIELNNMKIH